ncbi:MAG: LamG-like jellyroll fold domain-containing protein, partial [Candidatus Thorarchaeota archaeon]
EINASYNTGLYRLYKNFTSLGEGNYSYYAFTKDAAGNTNKTGTWNLITDYTYPQINFTSPTPSNDTFINVNYTYINLSVSDAHINTVWLEWNGTNVTLSGDGLVANVKFDDDISDGFNDSEDSYNGQITGATSTTGLFGNASYYDGEDDKVDFGDQFNLSSGTIEMWFKLRHDYDNSMTTDYMLAAKDAGGTSTGNMQLFFLNGNGRLRYEIYNSSYQSNSIQSDSASWTAEEWHHMTVTFGASGMRMYIDGVMQSGTNNMTEGIGSNGAPFTLGNNQWSTDDFNGSIDEFRVWNRVLTPKEINVSYRMALGKYYANITGLGDGQYWYQAHINDSGGSANNTEKRLLKVDTIAPRYVGFGDNSSNPKPNDIIKHYVNWSDLNGVSGWIFEWNGSSGTCGVWGNTSWNATFDGGWTNVTKVIPSSCDGKVIGYRYYANDSADNWNQTITGSYSVVAVPSISLSKQLRPDWILPRTATDIVVNVTVTNNASTANMSIINVTDEVPSTFTPPTNTSVDIYFDNGALTKLTSGYSVNITDNDGDSDLEIVVTVNLTDSNIGEYLQPNESIRIGYQTTSGLETANATLIMETNSTVLDQTTTNQDNKYILSNVTVSAVLLRAEKQVFINPAAPANVTIKITIWPIGGNVTDISLADYLPTGAAIINRQVTYYNSSGPTTVNLDSGTDYIMDSVVNDQLPDGTYVDIYYYNLSTGLEVNWDGTLYEGDNITILYNATVVGGGSWYLPVIITGFDPQYQKHIKTEMYTDLRVPSFDVSLETLTRKVKPGDTVKAKLTMENVGGPKAKVDVLATYSVKTMTGELITEKTATFAVVEYKEKILELQLPESISPGMYTYEAFVTYTGREALSTDTFEVESENTFLYGVIVVLIAMILALFYKMQMIEKRLPQRRRKGIISVAVWSPKMTKSRRRYRT